MVRHGAITIHCDSLDKTEALARRLAGEIQGSEYQGGGHGLGGGHSAGDDIMFLARHLQLVVGGSLSGAKVASVKDIIYQLRRRRSLPASLQKKLAQQYLLQTE